MITKLFTNYRTILPLMLIVPLALVACGGDSDDSSDVLPTRVVIGDNDVTAEVTEGVVDSATEDPLPTEEPIVATEETEVTEAPALPEPTPTQEIDSNPPPPPPGNPPDDVQQQSDDDTTQGGPPGTDSNTTTNAGPPGVTTAITDFSSLAIGESVLVSGVVSIVGEGEDAIPLITDTDGISIEMQAPVSMAEAFQDSETEVFGEIVEASGNTDAVLAIMPSAFSGSDPLSGPGGLPGDQTAVNEGDNAPPFLQEIAGEVLDFTVDAGATALDTYDAVIAELGDTLDGLFWTRLSGSSTNGWTIEFLNPEALTVQTYVVDPEGVVTATAPLPAPPITDVETDQLDRDIIVVDSDYVEAQVDSGDESPFGSPSVTLNNDGDGSPVWTIIGPEPIIIDATTDPE